MIIDDEVEQGVFDTDDLPALQNELSALPLSHEARGSALLDAARHDAVRCAEWLLDRGVPVDVRDEVGRTPLHLAAMEGQPRVAKLLIERGADVNASFEGRTPLELALQSREVEDAKAVVALLRAAGARDSLQSAVASGKIRTIEKILAARGAPWGIDATAALADAVSAAAMDSKFRALGGATSETSGANERKQLKIVALLLKHGADPNGPVPEGSWSPLGEAAQGRSVELVEMLLAAGADPHKPEPNGTLPVRLARSGDDVRALLRRAMGEGD